MSAIVPVGVPLWVKPGSQMGVKCRFRSAYPKAWIGRDVHVTGRVLESKGLLSGSTVDRVRRSGTVHVTVVNVTNVPMRLYDGCMLGSMRKIAAKRIAACENEMPERSYRASSMREEKDGKGEAPRNPDDEVRFQIDPGLPEAERQRFVEFLERNRDILLPNSAKPSVTHVTEHHIDTGDGKPFKLPPHRHSYRDKEIIDAEVDLLLERGSIQPSESPYSSPIVVVTKKDGKARMCIDYRRLNAQTVIDSYPLPLIAELLESAGGSRYYSSMDMLSGYHQVPVAAADRHKTAFVTWRGLWEWRVMPFGLVNAPATFQRLMNIITSRLSPLMCLVYLDDILVHSRTLDEHFDHLQAVFDVLRQAGLSLKASKCFWGMAEVQFLGHVVSKDGVRPDPEKVASIHQFDPSRGVSHVRTFLGMAGYYRRFIKDYSTIARPLHDLCKTKDAPPFEWTEECAAAAKHLKRLLTTAPILWSPTLDGEFILATDASDTGLGAVLSQKVNGVERPVIYLSRALKPAEKNYSVTERECLAVVWAVDKLHHFLHNNRYFTLITDHNSLRWLQTARSKNAKLTRWGIALSDYLFNVHYRRGAENTNADALSRLHSQDRQGGGPVEYGADGNVPEGASTSTVRISRVRESERAGDKDRSRVVRMEDKVGVERPIGEGVTKCIGRRKPPVFTRASGAVDESGSVRWKRQTETTGAAGDGEPSRESSTAGRVYVGAVEGNQRRPRRGESQTHGGRSRAMATDDRPSTGSGDDWGNGGVNDPSNQPIGNYDQPRVGWQEWMVIPAQRHELRQAQREDKQLSLILLWLEHANEPKDASIDAHELAIARLRSEQCYVHTDGVLYHVYNPTHRRRDGDVRMQIAVPSKYVPAILEQWHNWLMSGGHQGWNKTYDKVKYRYWWPSMLSDVRHWVQSCTICQQRKTASRRTTVPRMARQLPSQPWEQVCMDVLTIGGGVTSHSGNGKVLVLNDVFTRWAEAYAIPNEESETIARCLVQHICRFGCPTTLISDKAANFRSSLMLELYRILGVRKISTTAYHPQGNGITERFNRTLLDSLRVYLEPVQEQKDWDEYLHVATFAYNVSVNGATQYSPYYLLYGREPTLPADLLYPIQSATDANNDEYRSPEDYVNEVRFNLLRAHAIAHANLDASGQEYKRGTEHAATLAEYTKGQKVWVYRPYAPPKLSRKLYSPWYGPFVVVARLNYVTYRVRLQGSVKAKHTFNVHALRLKPVHMRQGRLQDGPLEGTRIDEDDLDILQSLPERKQDTEMADTEEHVEPPDADEAEPVVDTESKQQEQVDFEPSQERRVEPDPDYQAYVKLQEAADQPGAPPSVPDVPEPRRSKRQKRPVDPGPVLRDYYVQYLAMVNRRSARIAAKREKTVFMPPQFAMKRGTADGANRYANWPEQPVHRALKTGLPATQKEIKAAEEARQEMEAIRDAQLAKQEADLYDPSQPEPARASSPPSIQEPASLSGRKKERPRTPSPEWDSDGKSNLDRSPLPGRLIARLKQRHPFHAYKYELRFNVPNRGTPGRGVFSKQDIPKGRYVCEYVGILRTVKQSRDRYARRLRIDPAGWNYDPPDVYTFTYKAKYTGQEMREEVLDAGMPIGTSEVTWYDTFGVAPFINHSRHHPNLYTKMRDVDGHKRVLFFSLKRIKQGEELLYDYGSNDEQLMDRYPWLRDS